MSAWLLGSANFKKRPPECGTAVTESRAEIKMNREIREIREMGLFPESFPGGGKTRQFSHNGRDDGFDALMKAGVQSGKGAVIMVNANVDSPALAEIMDAIAKEYHWP